MSCATLAFIDGLGGPEMLLIFVLVLVLFGGQKLPEFARGLGKTMREFKKAASGVEEEFKRALEEDERKQQAEEERKRQAALPAGGTATDTTSATASPNDPAGPHIDPYNTPDDYPYYDSTPSPTGTDPVDPQKKTTEGATQPAATAPEAGATAAAPESAGTATEVASAGPDASSASAPAPAPAQPAPEPEKKP